MTKGANLSCFRCGGEFDAVGSDGTDLLYQCEDCEMSLTEKGTKKLAEDDSTLGRLAEVLLERAEVDQ